MVKAKSNPSKHVSAIKSNKLSSCSKIKKNKTSSGGGGNAWMTILNKAAALKMALQQDFLERKKLSAITGIQGKSTIANALTKLKNDQLMNITPDSITITAKGLQRADPKIVEEAAKDIPTTNKAHHENVKAQLKLKPKQTELFDYIQDGRTYQKAEVATAINLKMNSTFSNLLTSLKKIGVIEFDRTTIRLTDEMFPFGPRGEQEELRIWSGVLRLFDFEVLRKA